MRSRWRSLSSAVVALLPALGTSAPAQLSAPVLLAPPNGAAFSLAQVLNGQVLLDWTDVAGAREYEVDIQGPPGFVNFLANPTQSQVVFRQTTLDGVYVWRVRALDTAGAAGLFSATRSFSVQGRVEPTATPTPSPTPTPRLPADLNNDLRVNVPDLWTLARAWQRPTASLPAPLRRADLDGNGFVDKHDLLRLRAAWHQSVAP